MKTSFAYPAHKAELAAHKAANPVHKIVHSGDVVIVLTGNDIPAAAVPAKVTPRQIRLALSATGLRASVESAVAAGSQDLKDWWEYALEIERNHPLIIAMGNALNKTSEELDDLWRLAATL